MNPIAAEHLISDDNKRIIVRNTIFPLYLPYSFAFPETRTPLENLFVSGGFFAGPPRGGRRVGFCAEFFSFFRRPTFENVCKKNVRKKKIIILIKKKIIRHCESSRRGRPGPFQFPRHQGPMCRLWPAGHRRRRSAARAKETAIWRRGPFSNADAAAGRGARVETRECCVTFAWTRIRNP